MLLYKCVTSFESPCNAWNRLLYHLGRIPDFRCTENTFATDDRRMEDSEYTNGRCGIGKLTENFTGMNWKNRRRVSIIILLFFFSDKIDCRAGEEK